RRHRRRESVRIVVRDVLGIDGVDDTLRATSSLADACLVAALDWLTPRFEARFGVPRNAAGEPQRLVVVAMGKLGGNELNFSSDVDLVFAFPEAGQCDGPRGLANEDFFARLGQRLIQWLGDVTADGFAYRVDMRLRPFGAAGRLALSFAAMEQYYQRDGRDWERYAWIKARIAAGDAAAGARLLESLRPFVFRRYLDFTAIDGLRAMKRLIDGEVARQELAQHLKLGPGGIREVEFMVQLVQLVRGGREPALRVASLLPALAAAEQAGHFDAATAAMLRDAYRFLRRVENRVQMLRDEQAHVLPDDPPTRLRIAVALGHADATALDAALDAHRASVAAAFAATLAPRAGAPRVRDGNVQRLWAAAVAGEAPDDAPFAPEAWAELAAFARGPAVRALDSRARQRLEQLMPLLLDSALEQPESDAALARLVRLLQAIAGRPSYLALLDESPATREQLAALFARSAWLAERVTAHPLLLDDLLDPRAERGLPDAAALSAAAEALFAAADDDPEHRLDALHEFRQAALLRIALAWLDGHCGADDVARALANVADLVVARVLALALADAHAQHGRPGGRDGGLVVLGYGSAGGAELGFNSDLDLVFVYDDALGAATTDGARPVEGSRCFARAAQRVVHWLTTATRAGRLYDVDMRLRPDGAKGLLVASATAFADYQAQRAWLWEHQALVRMRVLAGDPALAAQVEGARAGTLARRRDPAELLREVPKMRERWRSELDRSVPGRFDLKQGRGGLVDIEFLVQALVLRDAAHAPSLAWHTRTRALLAALADADALPREAADALAAAHEWLLARAHDCALDARPRVIDCDADCERRREEVAGIVARLGLSAASPA
ncbi:MAG TPA: bifunctional [glutamate--ammonia ligase]-adenylyl-L-tyrosine phosphorylase/[glutamate--ammonia-ligase] adenylyltransferase, partial [Xanthomonadales bacterium]|nr:bifunctional [glutamate--ammonia ligase]-adenylyl-L-tyrosine phosphorylase/[glutamate--ammonia-ligase] adenylyltransferase [Xanthomonadales bacterium]